MKMHNVGNVNQFYTHIHNIAGFGVDTDDSTLVYLVGREAPVKVDCDLELAVEVFQEEASALDSEDDYDAGFTPVDELSEEELAELRAVADDLRAAFANENPDEKGAN